MSKLVNIADIEIWHTYLGEYADYFALYYDNVGFYRLGPEDQKALSGSVDMSSAHDSIEIDCIRNENVITLRMTPCRPSEGEIWVDHDYNNLNSTSHFINVITISLDDPDGPTKLQKKIQNIIDLFDIKREEIQYNLVDSLME